MDNSVSLKAIIIDDEPNAIIVMELLLQNYCPNVEVVASTQSSIEGVELIKKYAPDILFLDIEMPQLNGFQLLQQVSDMNFHLIFTTAYDEYAVKAFKFSALDYLLKPIEKNELINAVKKTEKQQLMRNERLNSLSANMEGAKKNNNSEIIVLPQLRGYIFQPISEILYCQAHNTYTTFYFDTKPALLVSMPLGDVEELLQGGPFFRIHRQYLVNTKKIKELIRSDGGFIIMNNDVELTISRGRKEELLSFIRL